MTTCTVVPINHGGLTEDRRGRLRGAGVNPRLIGWVCEWLGEVGVVEPADLRKAVRKRARKAVDDQDRFEEMFGVSAPQT